MIKTRLVNDLINLERYYEAYETFDFQFVYDRLIFVLPYELRCNQIVFEKFATVRSKIDELRRILNEANFQKESLNKKYLDIEKKPYIHQLKLLEEQALTCYREMNKNLSPYHWEWLEYEDERADLVILSKDYMVDHLLAKITDCFTLESKGER